MSSQTSIKGQTAKWVLEIVRIANKGYAEAMAENRRLGIPKFYYIAGKIYYETPEGELTTEEPEMFKSIDLG